MAIDITDPKSIIETEKFIFEAFDLFVGTLGMQDRYALDAFVVMDISRRFHLDEARIKRFHPEITDLDGHKKAGYLCYWASKLRPITIRDFSVYEINPKTPRFVNEVFALVLGFGKINYIQKTSPHRIGPGIITKDFITSLLHTLKFRVTTGDNLSMLFYLVDELVQLKTTCAGLDGYGRLNVKGKEKLQERLLELLRLAENTAAPRA